MVDELDWSEIRAWPDVRLGARRREGSINAVRDVEVNGRRGIARVSARSADDLDWEINLLGRLRSAGLGVPELVPTSDGRFRSGRMVIMEWVDGSSPDGDRDSFRVAEYLRRLHEVTSGWRLQRPGWCRCAELVTETRCGPVDLSGIPADVIARLRRAWSRLRPEPLAIIHGDPTPPNVRIHGESIVLLDWDEARVDNPILDFTYVPAARSALSQDARREGEQAFCAWETALFWASNRDYARRQLARVDAIETHYRTVR